MNRPASRELAVLAALAGTAVAARLLLTAYPVAGGWLYVDAFAVVGILSLVAGFALGSWKASLAPLAAMVASDIILYLTGVGTGFSAGFLLVLTLFVYSGFAMMAGVGAFAGKTGGASHPESRATGVLGKAARPFGGFALFLGASAWGSLLFDAWTNFGFWLGPFYPHTADGLLACFAAGIPFALGHLLAMALLSPLAYGAVVLSREYVERASGVAHASS